jgi:hypothetical protein
MKKILLIIIALKANFIIAQTPSLQWAKQIGDPNGVAAVYSMAVDAAGNVYTTGNFSGTVDFDPGPASYTLTAFGINDAFITKLNASGNFIWTKQLGGINDDLGQSVAVDATGNVYTTGYFTGTADFDPGAGSYTFTASGVTNCFVTKLNASGAFVWAKQLVGTSYDIGIFITVDAAGNIYTTGDFSGTTDFDPGSGSYTLMAYGINDAFISKLDASGNFVWAKQLGGTNADIYDYSIAIDATGNLYTSGTFKGTVDLDPGAGSYVLSSVGVYDIFINKLDAAGNFVWAQQLGGAGDDAAYSIVLDGSGNIYTSGSFSGTADFDPGPGSYTLTTIGVNNAFVNKLDASGNFLWAKQWGGTAGSASSIALDATGIYTTGYFSGTVDFDPGPASYTLATVGAHDDVFVHKLDATGTFLWAKQLRGISDDSDNAGQSVAVDASGNVYTAGNFSGAMEFDSPMGTQLLNSLGAPDAFIQKLGQCSAAWISNCTGLNDIDQTAADISLYPNPFQNNITVVVPENQETPVQIMNALGSCIYSGTVTGGKKNIDLSDQPGGIYFIKIGSVTKKIIKG